MIPRLFHRVYLDEEVPEKFEGFWRRFQLLHPTWEFRTWNDSKALDWLHCRKEFRMARTWAGKSDILRYELLYRYGGVYVDTDVEPLKAFDGLLHSGAFAGWESDTLICPTVMGAEAGHPALAVLLNRLPGWFAARPMAPPNYQTGPNFLTKQWRRRKDVRLLDRNIFYPIGWWERDRLGGPYPEETLSVHHWNQGWDLQAKEQMDRR